MPTPPTKFLNMPLGEQLVQEFDIVHKSKRPSHLLEGLPWTSSFGIVGANLILVVDLIQIFPTKKIWKKEWEFNQMFQDVWDIKIPCVEAVIGPKGEMTPRWHVGFAMRLKKKKNNC